VNEIRKILYTAEATVQGGREGSGRTNDDRLAVDLDVPTEMGGSGGPGTNPEQLFAVGYAACFQSALLRIASGSKLDLGESRITSHVSIGPDSQGAFGLAVTLDLDSPELGREQAVDLMARAHEVCPYSRATRGNISVVLMVGGQPIAETVAVA
jgi:lipoyl-dependent peroxiredoxin